MSTKTLTARFRSIGPIASWEMTLPGPGLHLLMGPPESGKSTIERALTLASMDRPAKRDADRARIEVSWDAEPSPGRGLPEGQIMLPGLSGGPAGVTLRADGRVTRLPDPPAVTILAGDAFVSLTRHGLVAQDTARAAELRTFAEITGVTTAPCALVPAEHLQPFLDIAEGPLVDVAEEVRKRGHALKARALDDAAAIERKVNVLKDAADPEAASAEVPSVADALAAQRAAEEEAARLRIERRGRIRAEAEREQHRAIHPAERPDPAALAERAQEARAELDRLLDEAAEGLPPEPDVNDARDRATLADAAAERAATMLESIRAEIAELQRREAAAVADLATTKREAKEAFAAMTSAELAHAAWKVKAEAHEKRAATIAAARKVADDAAAEAQAAEQRAQAWDTRQALLSSPVEGPEPEELGAAEGAAADARAVVEMAKRAEAEAARAAEEAEQAESLRKAQVLADTYEAIATTGLRARIRAVLEGAALTGWGISDDGALLCADPARGGDLVPFSALSGSTKDAAAMGLILSHAGDVDPSRYLVMLLPQEVADGMIADQLAGLSRLARERGVYIVGGKVADGELRIVTVE